MGRIFITFILTSAFWIWYYSDYAKMEDNSEEQTSTAITTQNNATTSDTTANTKPATTTPSTSTKPKAATATTATTATEPQPKEKEKKSASNDTPTTVTQLGIANLYGKWQPIEGAEYPLEFTKYGAVIQTDEYGFISRYAYSIKDELMKIKYDNAQFKLLSERGSIYLEIYNSKDFSGRYKKVGQPQQINATLLPKEDYPTLIVGKWTPINGHTDNIEITKFGTVIQTDKYGFDSRNDYSLTGDHMEIKYDKNARVVISEDANYYYLEIYNTTDFSGRYRKKK